MKNLRLTQLDMCFTVSAPVSARQSFCVSEIFLVSAKQLPSREHKVKNLKALTQNKTRVSVFLYKKFDFKNKNKLKQEYML